MVQFVPWQTVPHHRHPSSVSNVRRQKQLGIRRRPLLSRFHRPLLAPRRVSSARHPYDYRATLQDVSPQPSQSRPSRRACVLPPAIEQNKVKENQLLELRAPSPGIVRQGVLRCTVPPPYRKTSSSVTWGPRLASQSYQYPIWRVFAGFLLGVQTSVFHRKCPDAMAATVQGFFPSLAMSGFGGFGLFAAK
ncbi:hypothetical protein OF83DRAFT_1085898 [Amylostereum chailletii]|nr:hypothetical protein OF83DRAFT_1085898 [Amylostereum chailletii]